MLLTDNSPLESILKPEPAIIPPTLFDVAIGISPELNVPIDNVPSPPLVLTIPFVVVSNLLALAAVPVVFWFHVGTVPSILKLPLIYTSWLKLTSPSTNNRPFIDKSSATCKV